MAAFCRYCHIVDLRQSVMRLHTVIMLFHLFVFLSHMNWSIFSYSVCKLTIRMIRVHIVIYTLPPIGKHSRYSTKLCPYCQCRKIASPFLLFLFPFSHLPHLFHSHVPPSSVSCLPFKTSTVSRVYNPHISLARYEMEQLRSMITHN